MTRQKETDPRHTFFFVGEDGRRYSRELYWEDLYAFTIKSRCVLVASRVVPYSSAHYALYEMLKFGTRSPVLEKLLLEVSEPSIRKALEGGTVSDITGSITNLLPDRSSSVPRDLLAKAEMEFEETVSKALVSQGIEQGLDVFSDPAGVQALADRFADPTDVLHAVAGSEGGDAALINLSFQVDTAVKEQMRRNLEADVSPEAIARQSDLAFDVNRRLYANPKYLAFVKRIMDAQGSYVSPVVRDFLSFYAKCLNAKLHEHAASESTDPDILQKRLEGVLGRVKNPSHYALNYHDLTILGYVNECDLLEDENDPDSTEHSFKIDPRVDVATITMNEVEGVSNRLLVKKLVEFVFNGHHNIKTIQFIADVETEERATGPEGWLTHRLRKIGKDISARFPSTVDQQTLTRLRNAAILIFAGLVVVGFVIIAAIVIASLRHLS